MIIQVDESSTIKSFVPISIGTILGLSRVNIFFLVFVSDRPEGGVSQENTSKGKGNFFSLVSLLVAPKIPRNP